jgi:hypothetical protein
VARAVGAPSRSGAAYPRREEAVAGAIDPTGGRKEALDAFLETKLREGFEIETHTDTHAIVVERGRRNRS